MTTAMQHLLSTGKTVLHNRVRVIIFLGLTLLVAYLLFLIPVKLIPGNDVRFQASLFGPIDYVLLSVVAALESLLLMMWGHLLGQKRLKGARGGGTLGVLSGVPAFLFGTKLCPMCVAGILGFLGPSAVWFTVEHRLWFFALSAVVLLVSMYSVARKINGVCEHCIKGSQAEPLRG